MSAQVAGFQRYDEAGSVPPSGSDVLRLMAVHAHPDDESSKGAATMARYVADGADVLVCTLTGGERGSVLNPAMDRPEVRADLPAIRRRELEASAAIIGYDEVVLMGYRDSGMPDSPENAHPEAFANAPLDDAVGRLVAVVRRTRPQVVVTYPEDQRDYRHPDHLRVHDVAAAAFEEAGDPAKHPEAGAPWTPSKLYYTVWPRQRNREMHAKYLELGLESPFDEQWLARLARDEPTTTSIALDGFTRVRADALRAHATQVDPTSPHWFGLPDDVMDTLYPYDDYFLAKSRVQGAPAAPPGALLPLDARETDLFAGVR